METVDTIKLLIIHDSLNETERFTSLLRNAGKAIRPQHVRTEAEFINALQKDELDMILAQCESEGVSPDVVMSHIKQINKDIPVLLLQENVESQDIVEGLRLGAKDVISEDEDFLLLLVVDRELDNLVNRRARLIAEKHLKETEKRCELLLDSSMDAIAYIHDGMHIHANPTYVERFGYESADEISCRSIIDLIAEQDLDAFKKVLREHTESTDFSSVDFTFQAVQADGSTFAAHMTLSPAEYEGEPCTQVLIKRDQGASEAIRQAIETISNQDLMTGLANRPHFNEKVTQAVELAENKGTRSAIIYITIDNVNTIRSDNSMAAADVVLGDIAMLLRRESDASHTLARFAEDVFTMLIPEDTPKTAFEYANKLADLIEHNISEVDEQTIQATCSIGIAMINKKSENGELAIAKALDAANTARQMPSREGCVFLFEEEVDAAEKKKEDMAMKLELALKSGQFKLLFQPIISLRGSGNEYYEVLLRMVDENSNEISPAEFLGHAEKLQVTNKLDRWVILNSVKALAEHLTEDNNTHIIINLSTASLQDGSLVPWVRNVIHTTGIAPNLIIFQINEADAGNYLNDAKTLSKALTDINCQCVISRFGCSAKPFNLLKHLNVKYVKIDGSYTLDIQNENKSPDALIDLIKELHNEEKQTIIPCVENANILSILWQAGAHYIQGHYLQAPSSQMDYDFTSDE